MSDQFLNATDFAASQRFRHVVEEHAAKIRALAVAGYRPGAETGDLELVVDLDSGILGRASVHPDTGRISFFQLDHRMGGMSLYPNRFAPVRDEMPGGLQPYLAELTFRRDRRIYGEASFAFLAEDPAQAHLVAERLSEMSHYAGDQVADDRRLSIHVEPFDLADHLPGSGIDEADPAGDPEP